MCADRDTEFERYDFGAGVTVEDFSGWETDGLRGSSRLVYVLTEEDGYEGPTTRLRFVVDEDEAGRVRSAAAMDAQGCVWGKRVAG